MVAVAELEGEIALPLDTTPLILRGHAIEVLNRLPRGSVQTCFTSPPYYGLRRYDICACSLKYRRTFAGQDGATGGNLDPEDPRNRSPPDPKCKVCHGTGIIPGLDVLWGGRAGCVHSWEVTPPRRHRDADDAGGEIQKGSLGASYASSGGRFCTACGGWFGQLGLEPTPQLFVEHLCMVIDALEPVLRDDGTLWLNLGDTYHTDSPIRGASSEAFAKTWNLADTASRGGMSASAAALGPLKPKNLIGIPWRVAFALQDRGWILRADCIWEKPNPMAQSVKDRPTVNHEYVFLFSKQGRYYYDRDGERLPYAASTVEELKVPYKGEATKDYLQVNVQNPSAVKRRIVEGGVDLLRGANMRTVWKITVHGFAQAHFATYPEPLPTRGIKLTTSEGGACGKCGAPLARKVRAETEFMGGSGPAGTAPEDVEGKWGDARYGKNLLLGPVRSVVTVGWSPSCECGTTERGLQFVIDPFGGSGTTAMAARKLGRGSISIDVNPAYEALHYRRPELALPSLDSEW